MYVRTYLTMCGAHDHLDAFPKLTVKIHLQIYTEYVIHAISYMPSHAGVLNNNNKCMYESAWIHAIVSL